MSTATDADMVYQWLNSIVEYTQGLPLRTVYDTAPDLHVFATSANAFPANAYYTDDFVTRAIVVQRFPSLTTAQVNSAVALLISQSRVVEVELTVSRGVPGGAPSYPTTDVKGSFLFVTPQAAPPAVVTLGRLLQKPGWETLLAGHAKVGDTPYEVALDLLAYVAQRWRANTADSDLLAQATQLQNWEAYLAGRSPVRDEQAALKQWPAGFNARELQLVNAYS